MSDPKLERWPAGGEESDPKLEADWLRANAVFLDTLEGTAHRVLERKTCNDIARNLREGADQLEALRKLEAGIRQARPVAIVGPETDSDTRAALAEAGYQLIECDPFPYTCPHRAALATIVAGLQEELAKTIKHDPPTRDRLKALLEEADELQL